MVPAGLAEASEAWTGYEGAGEEPTTQQQMTTGAA